MIPGSIQRELEDRIIEHLSRTGADLVNYILRHMLDPPKTLKTMALEHQMSIHELNKFRGISELVIERLRKTLEGEK